MLYNKGNELKVGIAGEYYAMYYLTLNGFDVAKTEQGSHSDIFLDSGSRIFRIQVKTTFKYREIKNKNFIYNVCRFGNRFGKGQARTSYNNIDIFCYVCLETKEIAFISGNNIPQCIEFMSEQERNNRKKYKIGLHLDEMVKYYKNNNKLTPTELSKMFDVPVSSVRSRIKNGGIFTSDLADNPKTFSEYGIENLKKIIMP